MSLESPEAWTNPAVVTSGADVSTPTDGEQPSRLECPVARQNSVRDGTIDDSSQGRDSPWLSGSPPRSPPADVPHQGRQSCPRSGLPQVALESGKPDLLLLALGDRARGTAQAAKDTGLGRESLYKALAPGAKPRFDTTLKVPRALGVKLSVQVA